MAFVTAFEYAAGLMDYKTCLAKELRRFIWINGRFHIAIPFLAFCAANVNGVANINEICGFISVRGLKLVFNNYTKINPPAQREN